MQLVHRRCAGRRPWRPAQACARRCGSSCSQPAEAPVQAAPQRPPLQQLRQPPWGWHTHGTGARPRGHPPSPLMHRREPLPRYPPLLRRLNLLLLVQQLLLHLGHVLVALHLRGRMIGARGAAACGNECRRAAALWVGSCYGNNPRAAALLHGQRAEAGAAGRRSTTKGTYRQTHAQQQQQKAHHLCIVVCGALPRDARRLKPANGGFGRLQRLRGGEGLWAAAVLRAAPSSQPPRRVERAAKPVQRGAGSAIVLGRPCPLQPRPRSRLLGQRPAAARAEGSRRPGHTPQPSSSALQAPPGCKRPAPAPDRPLCWPAPPARCW